MKQQLERVPNELPQLVISDSAHSIFHIELEELNIIGYKPHPSIKGPVAV